MALFKGRMKRLFDALRTTGTVPVSVVDPTQVESEAQRQIPRNLATEDQAKGLSLVRLSAMAVALKAAFTRKPVVAGKKAPGVGGADKPETGKKPFSKTAGGDLVYDAIESQGSSLGTLLLGGLFGELGASLDEAFNISEKLTDKFLEWFDRDDDGDVDENDVPESDADDDLIPDTEPSDEGEVDLESTAEGDLDSASSDGEADEVILETLCVIRGLEEEQVGLLHAILAFLQTEEREEDDQDEKTERDRVRADMDEATWDAASGRWLDSNGDGIPDGGVESEYQNPQDAPDSDKDKDKDDTLLEKGFNLLKTAATGAIGALVAVKGKALWTGAKAILSRAGSLAAPLALPAAALGAGLVFNYGLRKWTEKIERDAAESGARASGNKAHTAQTREVSYILSEYASEGVITESERRDFAKMWGSGTFSSVEELHSAVDHLRETKSSLGLISETEVSMSMREAMGKGLISPTALARYRMGGAWTPEMTLAEIENAREKVISDLSSESADIKGIDSELTTEAEVVRAREGFAEASRIVEGRNGADLMRAGQERRALKVDTLIIHAKSVYIEGFEGPQIPFLKDKPSLKVAIEDQPLPPTAESEEGPTPAMPLLGGTAAELQAREGMGGPAMGGESALSHAETSGMLRVPVPLGDHSTPTGSGLNLTSGNVETPIVIGGPLDSKEAPVYETPPVPAMHSREGREFMIRESRDPAESSSPLPTPLEYEEMILGIESEEFSSPSVPPLGVESEDALESMSEVPQDVNGTFIPVGSFESAPVMTSRDEGMEAEASFLARNMAEASKSSGNGAGPYSSRESRPVQRPVANGDADLILLQTAPY